MHDSDAHNRTRLIHVEATDDGFHVSARHGSRLLAREFADTINEAEGVARRMLQEHDASEVNWG
jgi:hypothetical protein